MIKGSISHIGELKEFDSGFAKREFVIAHNEDGHDKIKCFSVQGGNDSKNKKKAIEFENFYKVGDKVEIKFNIDCREYEGRYYTNLTAWFIKKLENSSPDTQQENEESDLPF